MIIKLLLVPALVIAVVLSLRARASLRGQARRKILAGLTVVAGVVAVLLPGLLQALADAVGVTRGTDLMLYGLALVIIYLVGSTGVRFREQEARLVRPCPPGRAVRGGTPARRHPGLRSARPVPCGSRQGHDV